MTMNLNHTRAKHQGVGHWVVDFFGDDGEVLFGTFVFGETPPAWSEGAAQEVPAWPMSIRTATI
jgi:hypothetical protein